MTIIGILNKIYYCHFFCFFTKDNFDKYISLLVRFSIVIMVGIAVVKLIINIIINITNV